MSLKSQAGAPSLKSLPEDLCLGILRPEKIYRPQSGLNLRTLDLEASKLPRYHRGQLATEVSTSPVIRKKTPAPSAEEGRGMELPDKDN